MWIDDFLKYELHKALGHFPAQIGSPPTIPGRLEEYVYKDRLLAGQRNLRKYTLGDYIPTLFFGILMDSWIRKKDSVTPFVKTLENCLRYGSFEKVERDNLKQSLIEAAIKRINTVISQWSTLCTKKQKSFAALWIGGNKKKIKDVLCDLKLPEEDWLGWGLLQNECDSISSLDQVREPLHRCIDELIEDICVYIDWTLDWPNFIQSVRAVKTGTLALDVRFGQ